MYAIPADFNNYFQKDIYQGPDIESIKDPGFMASFLNFFRRGGILAD